MKKYKKISLIFYLLVLIISINTINLASDMETKESPYVESKIETTDLENDKLEASVIIKNFKSIGDGVNAYTGILCYDDSELELEEITSEGDWNSPIYKVMNNGKSAKVVATSNEYLNEEGKIFTAIFRKKVNKGNYNIEIKDLELATKIDGMTQKVEVTNPKDVKTENKIKSDNTIKNIVIILSIILIIVVVITIVSEIKIKGAKK